jgi:2-hydroxy-3-oxopropionate reductase
MKAPGETLGVIGLGIMGKPMASRLVAAGYSVIVHSRSPGPVRELESLGATPVQSPARVAALSDIVITMLPDSPDVEKVVLGPGGVLEGIRPGSVVIDMSTVAPSLAARLGDEGRAREVDFIDAPVSGGEKGAIDGTLSIMCGGSAEAVERARPIFAHLAGRVVHVGAPGAGQVVKACNQIVVALTLQAMGEALVLGAKAGIDPGAIVEALLGGAARCWALEVKGPEVLRRNFEPGFRCRLHHKDLGIALDAAGEIGVALPLTAAVRESFRAMVAVGRGDYDHSGVMTLIEDLANYQVNAGDRQCESSQSTSTPSPSPSSAPSDLPPAPARAARTSSSS